MPHMPGVPGPAGHPTAEGAPPRAASARLTTVADRRYQESQIPEGATGPVETELNPYLPDLAN